MTVRAETEKEGLLSGQCPGMGRIEVHDPDSATFGFAVARYVPGDFRELAANRTQFAESLRGWARDRDVELISTAAPANEAHWAALLGDAGFVPVDISVRVDHARLSRADLSFARLHVRRAEAADRARVLDIAGSAFQHGRYHTDLRFPVALAHHRYRGWVEAALDRGRDEDHVYVLGRPGEVHGMFYARLENGEAHLELGAVDKARPASIAGPSLYGGVMRALREAGAERAVSRPQLLNTPVINIYARLGFRFSEPEQVFHWHSPEARHLLPREAYLERAE